MRAVPFMRAHRRNISSTSCRDIETWSCRLCWGGENREREREREGELRPKRTFGRGCGMKESWRRRENDREGSLEHRVYRVVEKSGGKRESRKLK